MNKHLNRPVIIVVMLVAFFALTVLVSLRYSNNEAGKEKIRQSFWYRSADWSVKLGERIFSGNKDEGEVVGVTEMNLGFKNSENLQTGLKRYINLRRDENGITLIMQNSEGVFWERTWQIFPGKTKE